MIKQRQKYDREFNKKAVELSIVRGNASEIAEELDIRPELLYRWRREYDRFEMNSFPGHGKLKATALFPTTTNQKNIYNMDYMKNTKDSITTLVLIILFFVSTQVSAQQSSWVYMGRIGILEYTPDENGNVIPDFSLCGYKKNNELIPIVPVRKTVSPTSVGDHQALIQSAIDEVSALPLNDKGFRGAVLLKKGVYLIPGTLKISNSGVVLRGEGDGPGGTIIMATGTGQRRVLEVDGGGTRDIIEETKTQITEDYLSVGATSFKVQSTMGYEVGDKIVVYRPGTEAWIDNIGMNKIEDREWKKQIRQWTPDGYSLYYEREITDIEKDRVTIDVPIVMMIEAKKYTPGFIYKYEHTNRIHQVGIEGLRFQSTYKSATDEQHADYAVGFDNIRDGWLRNCTGLHFYNGIVEIRRGGKFITVADCQSLDPISRIWGGRRYAFNVNGAMNLVINCYSRNGRHDFVHGSRVAGPNAFVHCRADNSHDDTGPHHRWSTGTLFDNVKVPGDDIAVQDRGNSGSGHGWTGAQMVFWNVEADKVVCQAAPGSVNWSIGSIGEKHPGTYIKDRPQGIWEHHGVHVSPSSLFKQQVSDRLGVTWNTEKLPVSSVTATSAEESRVGDNTIDDDLSTSWIAMNYGEEINFDLGKLTRVDFLKIAFSENNKPEAVFEIQLSEDRKNWLTVFNGTSTSSEPGLEKYDLPNIKIQYVKIVGFGNIREPKNEIRQLEIWGMN